MRRNGISSEKSAFYLIRPTVLTMLFCFFAVFYWSFWFKDTIAASPLPDVWKKWLEPVYFGLIAVLLSLSFLILFSQAALNRSGRQAERQAADELAGLAWQELPSNHFWLWNWQSGAFTFSDSWLRSSGFDSASGLQAFLQDRLRPLDGSQGERPLACWEQLLHPDDVALARNQLQAFRETAISGSNLTGQYRILDSAGGYHWIRSIARAVIGPENQMLGLAAVYEDISEKITLNEQLTQEKSFTEGLINSTDLFVLLLDTYGRILRFNSFAERITGYTQAEVLGRSWIDCLFSETEKPNMRRLFERVKINQAIRQKRANIIHKDGQEIELVWHYHPVADQQGKTRQLAVIGMDVTDRRILEKQLYELAFFDKLTGLSNQTRLSQQLQHMISKRATREESLSIVCIDIDHFKHVNDSQGYATGDELLQWVAGQLRQLVKEPDIVARLGADEFAILLSTHRTERSVGALIHELQRLLRQPWQKDSQRFEITISSGVAFYPQHGADFKTLLQHANIALFDAKDRGRNQIVYYDQKMYLRNLHYIDQVHQLKQAIKASQFVLHYQLQYDLKTGQARGAEALIRWNHPERGLISPHNFIPLAEAASCIDDISQWALTEASRQKKIWNEQNVMIEKVAVNLSSYSFKLQDLTAIVQKALAASDLPGEAIELEITESALLDNIEGALEKISELQKQGITFVLDDFGTGYSSLTYLRQLPVRIIKIDRSFIRSMLESTPDARIVRAIIELAHDLGLSVVAEGIETRDQMRLLQSYDCDYGQGFLFHHPQPAGQIILHELGHPTINSANPLEQRFSR